jgi:hypothetical protein
MRLRALAAAAALVFAAAAAAEQPYVDLEKRLNAEELRATGLDTLTPAQLALLNRLLRDDTKKVVETVKAEAEVAQAAKIEAVKAEASAQQAVQVEAAKAEAMREASEPGGKFFGHDESPIKSRLKGSITSWEPGTVFELENGQRWKVLKGSLTLRKTLESPEVQVIAGIAGRWFLEVDEDMPKARVYRID